MVFMNWSAERRSGAWVAATLEPAGSETGAPATQLTGNALAFDSLGDDYRLNV